MCIEEESSVPALTPAVTIRSSVQDLPLKIQLHGTDYAQLFLGKLRSLVQHANWDSFSKAVASVDHSSQQQALLNRSFVADPVGTLRQLQCDSCSFLPFRPLL